MPASVIIGNPDETNSGHVGFRNNLVPNIDRGTPASYIYKSCIPVPANAFRGFLNAEIGDEELYLENCELPWEADYQAQMTIHVNKRNPYYEYVSSTLPLSSRIVAGIYSKEDPYVITSTGTANFYYDSKGDPLSIRFYNGGLTGTYNKYDQPQTICTCSDYYVANRMAHNVPDETNHVSNSNFIVYPNPNNGSELMLKYNFEKDAPVKVTITTVIGAVLYETTFAKNSSPSIELSKLNLCKGMYAVNISNGTENKTAKLLISK